MPTLLVHVLKFIRNVMKFRSTCMSYWVVLRSVTALNIAIAQVQCYRVVGTLGGAVAVTVVVGGLSRPGPLQFSIDACAGLTSTVKQILVYVSIFNLI